ncbi:hypothetical protein VPHK406_0192 [Vibrio phage K406]
MCYCSPNLRTPCCGKVDCHPPEGGNLVSEETIMQNSQLQLWKSYTDKKQECEMLRDMLKECMVQCEYLLKTPPEEVWKSKVTAKLVGYGIYLRTGLKGE